MNALAAVMALLLCVSAVVYAQDPIATKETVDASAPAGDASIAERMADAMRRVHTGDVLGAQQIWRALAAEAQGTDDAPTLDQAEGALADIAFLRGHYAEVVQIYNGRLQRARDSKDQRLEADSLMQLALIDRRQGRLAEAKSGLEAALTLFRAATDRNGEGETLTHLGLVLLNQGAFVRAIETLDASLALQREGATVSLDRTYQYLGLLYLGLRDYDEARVHLARALQEARRLPDPMRASAPLGSLARIANDQGEFQAALDYAAEAQAISQRFESTPGLSYSMLERGRALLGLDRLDEAQRALEESRALSESVDQHRTVADANFTLGRVALKQDNQVEALRLFESAIPNYEAAGDVPQLLDAYRAMVPLLRKQGELERAIDLSVAAQALLEKISGRESSRRIALIEYRHQVEASERRIMELARENEINTLRLSREQMRRNFGIGIIVGLVGVAAVLGWLYRRSRRIGASLEQSNSELVASRRDLAAVNLSLAEKAQALQVAATSDALTGIANRRHVHDVLDKIVASANSHSRQMAVLMIDVDRFKSVNDRFGHGVGDHVLCRVVQSLQASVPTQALLGRFGGDEFLLVLPDFSLAQAQHFAESALAAVRDGHAADEPAITLSIGIAARTRNETAVSKELIEAADDALYRAKANGRDRAECANRSEPSDDWD